MKLLDSGKSIYIETGDVIQHNDKLYYVYSEDNVNIYCFEIHKKRKENEKMDNIIINRKTYYTNFKELRTFNRNDNIEINNIAYENEIFEILNKKHELKEKTYGKVKEKVKLLNNKFEIGTILKYGNSSVMYLYSDNGKFYGVDLLWYSIKPRIFEIKEIEKRKILGVKNMEEINNILQFLIENHAYNNKVEKIYKYIRSLIFHSVA